METRKHFIGGEWVPSSGDETIDVIDPSNAQTVARIPAGTEADVERAVAAASKALDDWSDRSARDRADILRRAAARVRAVGDEVARLQSIEMGKPISQSRTEVEEAAGELEYYASIGATFGTTTLADGNGVSDIVVREPYGVAALIVPWNFPVMITLGYLPGLLVTGNTVVLKPSERSPLSAIALVDSLDLPPGVVNLLLGDGRAGGPLVAHPSVDFVSLTGSTQTGRHVARACAQRLAPVSLELGGKDPVIVDADVDVAWAAEQVALGAFHNSGQICTSMERVFVHRDIAEEFTTRLAALADQQALGPASDPATTLGPLVDDRQRKIVESHVEDAVARGARVVAGGFAPDGSGFFYRPTVLGNVSDDMLVMTEETFGPVAPIATFDTFEEAVERATRTDYGLAATVLTANDDHAELAAKRLPAAVVWINEWWGGHPEMEAEPARQSGLGATGGEGWLRAVTRPKAIHKVAAKPAG